VFGGVKTSSDLFRKEGFEMDTNKKTKKVISSWAYHNKPAKPDYVIGNLPPGKVGLLVAAGGVGKTYLTLQILYSVARPEIYEWPVGSGIITTPRHSGKVLALLGEEDFDTIHRRMHSILKVAAKEWKGQMEMALEVWDEKIEVDCLAGTIPTLIDSEGNPTDNFYRLIKKGKGCRLIVIDPLARFHQIDENDNVKMTMLVQRLEFIAKNTGAALLVCHHSNKQGIGKEEGTDQQSARGASALTDGVRYQIGMRMMTRHEGKIRWEHDADIERKGWVYVEESKNNYGPARIACWARRLDSGF